MVNVNRRDFLIVASGAAAAFVVGMPAIALGSEDKMAAAIEAFTGGAATTEGGVSIELPEIAENGNTVPIGISIDSPMTADSYAKSAIILASGNPNPGVATFHFSPASGSADASTRLRLAKTQDVVVVAAMSDGSFRKAVSTVKVTIGGCGG